MKITCIHVFVESENSLNFIAVDKVKDCPGPPRTIVQLTSSASLAAITHPCAPRTVQPPSVSSLAAQRQAIKAKDPSRPSFGLDVIQHAIGNTKAGQYRCNYHVVDLPAIAFVAPGPPRVFSYSELTVRTLEKSGKPELFFGTNKSLRD